MLPFAISLRKFCLHGPCMASPGTGTDGHPVEKTPCGNGELFPCSALGDGSGTCVEDCSQWYWFNQMGSIVAEEY